MFQYFVQETLPRSQSHPFLQLQCQYASVEEEEGSKWEHVHMMKEDFDGLFYRKLNLIIMLEQSEQAYQQREILMISHRDHTNSQKNEQKQEAMLDVHPVTYLSKEMVRHNEKLKREMKLRRREAEIKVEINKLEIDRRCLLQEIGIFTGKIKDISYEYFEGQHCKEVQNMLLQHGKKYNLSTTVVAFIKQAKQISAANIISQCLKSSLKRVNCNLSKPILKFQDIKQAHSPLKSKKQLLDHITLYLKEFRSSAIYKELTQILNNLLGTYDKLNLQSHYLFNKISEEIFSNLTLFAKVNRELQSHNNQIKDYKIQLQILQEQIRISQMQIKDLEARSAQCISQEAAYLSKQYGQSKNVRFFEESFESQQNQQSLTDYFSYFQQQLKQKYQQFIRNQLQDAQHIRLLKQKIQDQTINLQRLRNFYNRTTRFSESELQTHRTVEQSMFSEFVYPLKQTSLNSHKHSKEVSERQSLRQSVNKTMLANQSKKQVFLVKKIFKICNGNHGSHIGNKKQKTYELKLTKKHLVLQQKTNNTLQFNEKVEIDRIKGYKVDLSEQLISFDCGLNTLKLQFLSDNIAVFFSKLQKLGRMAKENYMSSRR